MEHIEHLALTDMDARREYARELARRGDVRGSGAGSTREPLAEWKNERFNGILREELLNREIFYSLDEARVLIERQQRRYNMIRPRGAMGFKTPSEFAEEERVAGRWFSHENRAAD